MYLLESSQRFLGVGLNHMTSSTKLLLGWEIIQIPFSQIFQAGLHYGADGDLDFSGFGITAFDAMSGFMRNLEVNSGFLV